MLKFAVAGIVLALAAAGTPVFAAPRNYDCADCPVSKKYDSEEVVKVNKEFAAGYSQQARMCGCR